MHVVKRLSKHAIDITAALVIVGLLASPASSETLSPSDVINVRTAFSPAISPDGTRIAYGIRRARKAADKPGSAYRELHVVSTRNGESTPFVTGKVAISQPAWSPDGQWISFRMTRGKDAKTQVWVIPVDGGEAVQGTHSPTSVLNYHWHPDGHRIAYVATTPRTKREKALRKKGYGFVFYEENLRHRNLYTIDVDPWGEEKEAKQVTEDITVWSFVFNRSGTRIAAGVSEKNLIDQRYAFQKVSILDVTSGELRPLTNNPGKLGNFAFSPDGTQLAYTAARDRRDHAVSHAYVIDVTGGEARDLTPEDFHAHINWVGWRDKNTVVYRSGEGVWNTLNTVSSRGRGRKTVLDTSDSGLVFYTVSSTKDFKHAALLVTGHDIPSDIYYWAAGRSPKRLTTLNPWIADRELGNRSIVRYQARDGLTIEGLLYYPVGYREGRRYPLIVIVHGGPESHYASGWNTRYSTPTQVLTGRGYIVFLPNYRSSTGYGVDFTKDHLGDAAGKEFDDIADGIKHLIDVGLVDSDRVGLGGGSYGGFAAAWFATYYTKLVRATCMFVGISDLISKRGTTDIPYEELFVHSGEKLEDMWQKSLKHSPIYYAAGSRTAVLIYGGTDDTRVHPSQSLELYRRLKMNDHPAVRLVRYPGEHHGNAKLPGRVDVLYRTLQWWDWYVKDKKPLDGPMPPLDISESYGLDLE